MKNNEFINNVVKSGLIHNFEEMQRIENELEEAYNKAKDGLKKEVLDAVKSMANPCKFNTVFIMYGSEIRNEKGLLKMINQLAADINDEEPSINVMTAHNPNVENFRIFVVKPCRPVKVTSIYDFPDVTVDYKMIPVERDVRANTITHVRSSVLKND